MIRRGSTLLSRCRPRIGKSQSTGAYSVRSMVKARQSKFFNLLQGSSRLKSMLYDVKLRCSHAGEGRGRQAAVEGIQHGRPLGGVRQQGVWSALWHRSAGAAAGGQWLHFPQHLYELVNLPHSYGVAAL